MSNSSLRVSIVFCVSCLNYSLFSIWVFNSFLSFLLSSSSCLHFKALRRIFSLLLFIDPPMFYWLWATPPTALTIPPLPILAAPVSYWPISLSIRFLKFLISSTYCIRASLFFYIIWCDFSLQTSMSSILLKDKPDKNW